MCIAIRILFNQKNNKTVKKRWSWLRHINCKTFVYDTKETNPFNVDRLVLLIACSPSWHAVWKCRLWFQALAKMQVVGGKNVSHLLSNTSSIWRHKHLQQNCEKIVSFRGVDLAWRNNTKYILARQSFGCWF